MSQAELVIFLALQIITGGLKAVDQIVAIINRYGGVENVPLEEWMAMFKRSKSRYKPYWDWFKPTGS